MEIMEKIAAMMLSCLQPDLAQPNGATPIAVEQSCTIVRLQTVAKGKREMRLTVICKCEP
jgi:hypothetical protein